MERRRVTLETRCLVGDMVTIRGEALVSGVLAQGELTGGPHREPGSEAESMERHRHWKSLDGSARGASVAMGNFDGIHLGHQSVIEHARKPGLPLGVIMFEPHPRAFFAARAGKQIAPFRLMSPETRANRLAKLGVDHLHELPFDEELADMSAERFAREVLAGGLGVAHVAVGGDFRFGKGREGDGAMLSELGQRFGFEVAVAPLVHVDGVEVSSTAIRAALAEGRPRDAAAMLGHLHRIDGEVLHGEKRGRDLGFPTVNMSVAGLHLPKSGVYAVRLDVLTGSRTGNYLGAASLGVRPMFGENTPNLETYIFDFEGDLYGEHVSVALVDYLRPELKFHGIDALVAQMTEDCAHARDILATA